MRGLALIVLLCASRSVGAAEPISAPGTYPPGTYYLANDITITSGFALNFPSETIYDRHELNLNGKTIRCLTQGNDETFGIVGSGPSNLIIIGGGASWIDGCRVGVSSSRQTRVQEVIFTNIRYMAMDLSGPWSRVILNMVGNVGGVTDEAYAVGVNVTGPNPIIQGNYFGNFYRQAGAPAWLGGEGVAIILGASSSNAVVEMNYLANDVPAASIGIFAGGTGHSIRANTVRNFGHGIQVAAEGQVFLNTLCLESPVSGAEALSFTSLAAVWGNTVVGY